MTSWHPAPPIYAALIQDGVDDRVALVQDLLQQGEDPNATDHLGYHPLSVPCVWDNPTLLNILLEGGAQPNASSHGNGILGEIILSSATLAPALRNARLQPIQALLSKGASPNGTSTPLDRSPLWLAIRHRWPDAVQLLLSMGADPYRRDSDGRDALEWAIQWEHLDTVEALAGTDAMEAARARIPDPECTRLQQALIARLRQEDVKLQTTSPGPRYEYMLVHECYWHNGQWLQLTFKDHDTLRRQATLKRFADDDQGLPWPHGKSFRAWLAHQLEWTPALPPRDRWKRLMSKCLPRADEDAQQLERSLS